MNQDHSQPPSNTRVRGLKILSLLTLLAERITRCGWRLFCWGALFSALWLFEIQNIGGPWLGVLLLAVATIGAVYLLYTDLLRFRWPSNNDIIRRLEKDSAVRHRPLSGLKDAPINKEAQPLWDKEQQRRKSLLARLKPPSPKPFLARQDPYALRLGIILCVICGFIVAGSSWQGRFWSGLTPVDFKKTDSSKQPPVTFWITPPEYTGLERITPTADDAALHIPQGSTLKAFVAPKFPSFIRPPAVHIDEQTHTMQKADDGSFVIEIEIPDGQALSMRHGLLKTQSWSYNLIPDRAPSLSVEEQPKILGHAQIQFSMELHDDYGVENLHMSMALDPSAKDAPPEGIADDIFRDKRSIMSPADTKFNIAPVYDLAAHPWAGLPVVLTFTASDHLEQISANAKLTLKLPERAFTHPIAKRLIETRKHIIRNPKKPYIDSFVTLNELSEYPHKFNHDFRSFLALRVAASRMRYNEPTIENSKSLIALLWDTALRIEDGNLSLAARDLRDAQEALEKALQDPNTSDAEIAFLMQKMREALMEYLKAMAMELQKEMQQANQSGQQQMSIPPELLSQLLNMNDLASLLDQMESEMLSGDRNAAQEMLSQLQRLTDMANPSMNMAMPKDMQMMMEGINELQNIIERQEDLLNKTEKKTELLDMLGGLGIDYGRALSPNSSLMNEWDMQRMPPQPHGDQRKAPQTPFVNTTKNKEEQEELFKLLNELILKANEALDQVPESLNLAAQAMQGSSNALGQNRPDISIPYQEEVLKHLKDSQQQMAQQIAQRMQQMTGLSFSGSPMRYDPLGRPYGGTEDANGKAHGSHVKIPSEAEVKRVQEILNELRRRAGQRGRPREELDYYRRLLKRF